MITGASGQVGSELSLRAEGPWQAIPLSRHDLDITDPRGVRRALAHHRADAVINAAAYTAVDRSEVEVDAARRVNREGPRHLAAACRDAGLPLLHFSTDYVFDGTSRRPYRPEDPPSPLNVYGRTKWEGEVEIRNALDRHLILRTAWVFGYHGHSFVKTITRLVREREVLRVVDDQTGCPTAAGDLAEAALIALERALNSDAGWGTHHFVNTGMTTWYGFAESILELAREYGEVRTQRIVPIDTSDLDLPAARPAFSVLDTNSFTQAFGMMPRPWIEPLRDVVSKLQREECFQ